MMTQPRKILTVLVIMVLLGGGGYAVYRASAANGTEPSEPALQTAVVRQGSITVSATGAGSVIAAATVDLTFGSGGTLTELLVQVGDKVQSGDVLARVDDTDAQKALVNAQLQYAQTAMQTDATATQAGVSFDDISVAQARLTLEDAQKTLDELLHWQPDADEIALLETKLAAAEASYNAARGQEAASGTNISLKAISLEQAERDLADAQAAFDVAFDPGREWELQDPRRSAALESERARAESSLQRAQENLQVAQLNYSATVSSSSSSGSVSAQSNLLSAQQALAAAQAGPSEQQVAAAETAVAKAQLALQQALLNQESHALSLRQAELNLTAAETALAGTSLAAPMAGVVMAVNKNVGEQVGSSALLTLADLSQPMLEIFLDETDLDKVGLGYAVDVIFDAFPDDTFSGEVVQVDPTLYQSGGVSAVRAVVRLTYNKPQPLPVGLNATVEVIGGRAENALLVPVEALREIAPGQYSLFVLENDEPRLRMVEVGLMDFSFAQILSGVTAGEQVTTGIVQTQ